MFASLIKNIIEKSFFKKVIYFFPVQLLLVHFKKNQSLLFFWIILFGFIFQKIGVKYGFPTLFLDPEYLNKVNFLSFAIVGFALGGFIIAFNIASYIRNAYRFPFLATLSKPFVKYCLNNSLLPITFFASYMICICYFQYINEFMLSTAIVIDLFGLCCGFTIFIVLSFWFFNKVNKDIFQLFGLGVDDSQHTLKSEKKSQVKRVYLNSKQKWNVINTKDERDWNVRSYISSNLKIRMARGYEHYDKSILKSVYKQNYRNATIYQIILLLSIFAINIFSEIHYFQLPASASVLLILTILLMITSILYSFFKGWTNIFALIILILINGAANKNLLSIKSKLLGLNYKTVAIFSNENNLKLHTQDSLKGINYLTNWQKKLTISNAAKPKLILMNVSGGGLRSFAWVTRALIYSDSVLKNKLYNHTVLMSGASGGLIGAAYWRELNYSHESINQDQIFKQVSNDMLNNISLKLATNDIFFRLNFLKTKKGTITLDRGIALEQSINKNTSDYLNKPLNSYTELEQRAYMPILVISPTVLNNSKRMLISASPINYLSNNNVHNSLNDVLVFSNFFPKHEVSLTSILRAAASFPVISPEINLPTIPSMQLIDAGMRDNLGMNNTLQFLNTFSDWINENTSGIIILEIRDRNKYEEKNLPASNSIFSVFTSAPESFYKNLFKVQDFESERKINLLKQKFKVPFYNLNLALVNDEKQSISLSWHLNSREKKQVFNSIYSNNNMATIKKLNELFNNDK